MRKITSHSPFGDAINTRCVASQNVRKTAYFSHVFACDATGIDHIAKRRKGGDFSHRNRTFLYTSLSYAINIQILNCLQKKRYFSVIFHPQKQVNSHRNYVFGYSSHTKVMYTKSSISIRKITSCSPFCDAINTRCVASENVGKIAVLRTLWPATQQVLIASQNEEREVIFRIEIQLFCIHHFRV